MFACKDRGTTGKLTSLESEHILSGDAVQLTQWRTLSNMIDYSDDDKRVNELITIFACYSRRIFFLIYLQLPQKGSRGSAWPCPISFHTLGNRT
jgi:hypothetical protein